MKLYAALDVSLNKTAVCVMDHDGRLVREVEVPTCPDALAEVLRAYAGRLVRVGLEAGPMSEWLVRGLAGHGVEAVLMETRQAHKALSAMTVKTDRNDARGLAHLLRMGWFRPVHVKAVSAREQRARLGGARDAGPAAAGSRERRARPAAGLRPARPAPAAEPMVRRGPRPGRRPSEPAGHLRAAAAGARGAPRATRHAGPPGPRCRAGRPGLPPADDRARGRRRRGADLPQHHRRPGPVPFLPLRRRLPRVDAEALPIRRDRSGRGDQQGRGRRGQGGAVRGRACAADAGGQMVGLEGLGRAPGAAARRQARQGRGRPQAAGVLHRMWTSETDFRYGAPAAAMEG